MVAGPYPNVDLVPGQVEEQYGFTYWEDVDGGWLNVDLVKAARDMDGVEAYGKLHENYSRRTLGRMFRVQRECMYPKPVKDMNHVRLAIMERPLKKPF